jgi:hypothetical protein
MPRRLPEELRGKDLESLCIASKLSEAKKIESVLDREGIEYTFEIVEYSGRSVLSILFGGMKEGVMFKVLKEQYDFCRELLAKEGLEKNIVE